MKRRGRDDPVGRIRHLAPWVSLHCLDNSSIKRCFSDHVLVIRNRRPPLFISKYRQSVLLGQVDDFGEADRR